MIDLLDFLEEKAQRFLAQRDPNDRHALHDLLECVDPNGVLHLPENSNAPTIAEWILRATDLTQLQVNGLRDWLNGLGLEEREELTLQGIVEVLNDHGDLT